MLKFLQAMTATMRIYLAAIMAITLASLIDWTLSSVASSEASIHLLVAGLAGLGGVLIIVATILREPTHLPYTTVGFLTLFVLEHLSAVFGWQNVVSGPWSTWPAYVCIAALAVPMGLFVDFMIWAGMPRRDPIDHAPHSGDSQTGGEK